MWPPRHRHVVALLVACGAVAAVASWGGDGSDRPTRDARLVLPCAQPHLDVDRIPILLESVRRSADYGVLRESNPIAFDAWTARPRHALRDPTLSRRARTLKAFRSFTGRIRPDEVVTVQSRRVVFDAEACDH